MISDKISLKKILEWPKGFYYYFKIQVSKYFNKTVQSQLPYKNIIPKKWFDVYILLKTELNKTESNGVKKMITSFKFITLWGVTIFIMPLY